jgi:hypothetical protein
MVGLIAPPCAMQKTRENQFFPACTKLLGLRSRLSKRNLEILDQ